MEKIWKRIENANHEVSDDGEVRHFVTGRILKQTLNNGYLQVQIKINEVLKKTAVHRLVCGAFCSGQNADTNVVNHKDGNKTNNHASNLEWGTQKDNVRHFLRSGLSNARKCKITQLSLDGSVLQTYESLQEIEQKYGYDRASIIRVCKGKQMTSYGSKWLYSSGVATNVPEPADGKTCKEFPNYVITPCGRVYSRKTKAFLKPLKTAAGYVYVTLSGPNTKKKNCYIHTLIARLFVPEPTSASCLRHKNGIKDDNRIENIYYLQNR